MIGRTVDSHGERAHGFQGMTRLEPVYFATPAGGCQVKDFLDAMDPVPREMGLALIDDLLTGEIKQRPKATAHLHGPIWELRWSFRKRSYRVTYCAEAGKIVLFWGFEKKTQQTPKNVIDQSLKRYSSWRKGNG